MGRLEKIVVLTVLFLVAVVLGVALTPSGESPYAADKQGPLEATAEGSKSLPGLEGAGTKGLTSDPAQAGTNGKERLLSAEFQGQPADGKGTPESPAPKAPAPTPNGTGNDVSSAPKAPEVTTPPVAPQPEVQTAPAPYVLTTEGLAATGIPDTMMYTWQAGDTFAAVATRYYGSKEKQGRLTKANEGRSEQSLKAGDRIWLPVAETAKVEAGTTGEQIYVVKKGDVLSAISQRYYGTSKKWQKILDANRDTLSSPEKLRPGMKLRIPE